MLKFKNILVVLATIIAFAAADQFPSYIKKCSKSDPKINDCIFSSTTAALPKIIKGDQKLLIPEIYSMNPADQVLHVEHKFCLTLKNIKAKGGELTHSHANMNFDNMNLEIGMTMPHLTWEADYETNGTLNENGKITFDFDNMKFNYLKQLDDSQTHLQVKSGQTTGSIDNIAIKIDGEKGLSQHISEVKPVVEERVKQLCGDIVTYVMNAILKTVPKDKVFLP